ncbi:MULTISPECIES: MarR family winged helix-turn-helix transcriptional regulator [Clostridiaceae]|nr:MULTISPECIES: MarR family transcriptional regulator [Clostridiaceae]
MSKLPITLLKYISMIYRNTNRYFDMALSDTKISSGQYFFLGFISENEGLTMYDLAKMGGFDKGTVTKAVQKLSEMDYVRIETDQNDKRVRHLYLTNKAKPVLERIYATRDHWKHQLVEGFTPEQEQEITETLRVMAEHSCAIVTEIAEQKGERTHGK